MILVGIHFQLGISHVDGKSRFREGGNQSFDIISTLRTVSRKKCIILDFVQMRGGAAQIFGHIFNRCIFG